MHVVAIVHAPAGADRGAADLAQRLEVVTALELRLALAGPLPRVLVRTPLAERANRVAHVLTAGGIGAVAVDLADVLPVSRMVKVDRLSLDAEALHASPGGPRLAYDDLLAIVRVAVTTSVLRITRAREVQSVEDDRPVLEERTRRTEYAKEHAVFLYVRDAVPWVLRAERARYLGLGALRRSTVLENFVTVVSLLRERAPHAIYDERFLAHPLVHNAEMDLGDDGVEVRVHVLAQALLGGVGRGPYR